LGRNREKIQKNESSQVPGELSKQRKSGISKRGGGNRNKRKIRPETNGRGACGIEGKNSLR